jgi:hypothetical protein
MNPKFHIPLAAARACAIGFALVAIPLPPVNAKQAPPKAPKGCVAVTKQEYDSAKKQNLLQSRFSTYVRTGRIGQRSYWYCRE